MKRRRWIRILLLVLLLPIAGLVLLRVGVELLSRGTRLCEICATCREETRLAGIPVWFGPAEESEEDLAIYEEYHRWHATAVEGSHWHSWRPIGCRRDGLRICCSGSWAKAPYAALPRLADQEWAKAFATRITRASSGERDRILWKLESVACGHEEHIVELDLPREMVEAMQEAIEGADAARLLEAEAESGL